MRAEPLSWLTVLIVLYFTRDSIKESGAKLAGKNRKGDALVPAHKLLSIFAGLRLISTLAIPIFMDRKLQLGLSAHRSHVLYYSTFWVLYVLTTLCVFLIIAALLRNSLRPLPGLSSAAVLVFRWASGLALVIALTAHIPVFGIHNLPIWLDEVSVSFALCVCTFEISLLALLLTRLERLGMCLRSRPVGLAIGLTLMGLMDLVSAMTLNLPDHYLLWIGTVNELVTFFSLAIWIYYIVFPEPPRNPHSLSPLSKLMRWNEVAMRLELSGRQAEPAPFISGVESIVIGVMKKYNIGNT